MSEHVTGTEWKQYFEIMQAGTPNEEEADFVNDIEAHVVECDLCNEKVQAIRYLMDGFSSNPDLAASLISAEFPETLAKPAFNLQKAFAGVKMVKAAWEGKVRVLADTLSDKVNVIFSPGSPSLAAARGDQEADTEGGALNDLLYSDMEVPLEEGRKITLKCRNVDPASHTRLYVYSNFKADFLLVSDEGVLSPVKNDHDKAANEYVWVYELDGQEFELTAR